MTYKFVDMALIGDKALDIYASQVIGGCVLDDGKKSTSCTKSSVMSIFKDILNSVASDYAKSYDRTYIVAPCFPLMRFKKVCPVMTRFICKNSTYLYEHGISSNQFLDYFEKFIQSSFNSHDRAELEGGSVILLKSKSMLLDDWRRLLTIKFGSSIMDFSVTSPFDANPGFITTMEWDLDVFEPIDEMSAFKAERLL